MDKQQRTIVGFGSLVFQVLQIGLVSTALDLHVCLLHLLLLLLRVSTKARSLRRRGAVAIAIVAGATTATTMGAPRRLVRRHVAESYRALPVLTVRSPCARALSSSVATRGTAVPATQPGRFTVCRPGL